MSQKNSVLKSSAFMALATMLSRVFGLVREQVIAYYYGAGLLVDAFNVAYRIPNLLRDLLAEGAFSSAFLAEFAKAKVDGKESMRELFLQCFWILAALGLFYALGLIFFAKELIFLYAPEYELGSIEMQTTVTLLKIMAPFLMFMSLGAVAMAVLNTHKSFFLPAVSPVFFNLVSILMVVGAAKVSGSPSIEMLAWGVLLGGAVQFLVQVPSLLKHGFAFTRPTKIWGAAVKEVFRKLIPGLLSFSASQINILVNTILATSSGVGAVSWLSYAFRIFQLPLGIVGVSLGTSNQVYFSEKWKSGELQTAAKILSESLFFSVSLMLFPCIFLVFFPSWPIEILFERGRFTANDSQMTAHALFAYSFGLPFYGMHKILLPVFYTINRQKTALVVAVVSILINIAFAIAMVPKYGFFVLAWSSTISIACHALLLYWLLPSKLFQKRNFFSSRQYVSFLALFFCLCGYFFALSEWLPQVSIAKIWWFFPLLVVPVGILDLFLWLSGGPVIFIRKIILKWKKTS